MSSVIAIIMARSSGNVWLTNNWLEDPQPQFNPGGHEIVAYVGLAPPVQPPLPRARPAAPAAPVVQSPAFTG